MSCSVTYDKAQDTFYFNCPHCNVLCQVPRSEIRCKIFRHANFKDGMRFVPPHASKEVCDKWVQDDLIWGCSKPFMFDGVTVEKCGYI